MMILSREAAREVTRSRLAKIWETNPGFQDMRFGQFMINLFSFVGSDPWHICDEEWPEILRQFGEKAGQPGQFRGEAQYARP